MFRGFPELGIYTIKVHLLSLLTDQSLIDFDYPTVAKIFPEGCLFYNDFIPIHTPKSFLGVKLSYLLQHVIIYNF